jgi:hypothetical protein
MKVLPEWVSDEKMNPNMENFFAELKTFTLQKPTLDALGSILRLQSWTPGSLLELTTLSNNHTVWKKGLEWVSSYGKHFVGAYCVAWILYFCLDWYGPLEQDEGLIAGDKDWLILYIIFIFILSSAWLSEGVCCGGQGSPP